ncbi:MAG: ABC transporter permease [Acidobacteria bacterium]|nr:ABC transporter permease [Acidobacteriota bacterium]MBI3421472.1 ABC transporter permease [Acidobacteriota bacterium]
METILHDLRYGARMLLKSPGLTVVAVLSLALGIGANVALFSVVNAVLLRPLPYPQPERLMQLGQSGTGGDDGSVGEPKFLFWHENQQAFEALALYQSIGSGVNLAGGNEAEFVPALKVSQDFFRVLGVAPQLGRSFVNAEDQPSGTPVAVLSESLWRRRFGGSADLIGRTVLIDSVPHTVIGVLPRGFQFLPESDVYVPLRPSLKGDSDPNYGALGRLKIGVTPAQAKAEMQLVGEKYRAQFPRRMQPNETVGVEPWQQAMTADARGLLWLLLGAVGFVLLIACANVANLQLTRATARQRELAVRQALGAGWSRVLRQLLTESLLLALCGGAAGLLLAVWGVDWLAARVPEGRLAYLGGITLDWRVLLFALAAAVTTGLLFGLAPAWQVSRVDVNQALKDGANRGMASASQGRLRAALVVAEVALSLLLLVGAGLTSRTFVNLREVKPGFDAHNVLTFQLSPNGANYDTTAKTAAFYDRALERLRALPGVESAAVTSNLPLSAQFRMPFAIAGQPARRESVQFRLISADYFNVLRVPVRQGRAFAATDDTGTEHVAVVNEAFARKFLANVEPLGQPLQIGRGPNALQHRIVGVVGDTKHFGLNEAAPPMMFIPAAQAPADLTLMMRKFLSVKFMVRTTGDPLALSAAVQQQLREVDAALPVTALRSLEEIVDRSVAGERFNLALLGLFALLGMALAAVGIYGVMSYNVAQRTPELSLRLALGAQPGALLRLMLGQGMKLVLLGVALGVAAALALTRVLKAMLFGVSATDPLTFALIALLLTGVAFLACWLPARRATAVDPLVALRSE